MWKLVAGAAAAISVLGGASFMLKDFGRRQFQAGYDARDALAWQADAMALQAQLGLERRQAQVTAEIAAAYVRQQAQVREVFRPLIREVPVYVDPETSARYPWPVGAVRLHDAGARGLAVSAVPDPAGRADDAPSDVGAADGIGTVLANYEACQADRSRLANLQDWVTAQREVAP